MTYNVRTLNRISQLPDLTASVGKHNVDIVCVQEHTYHRSEVEIEYPHAGNRWIFILASTWKSSANAVIGGVGMILSPHALKSVYSIEKIQPRMMVAMFNGNHITMIIFFYSPTNASEETDFDTFYNELSLLVRSIPKHKVNAEIGKHTQKKPQIRRTEIGNI